MFQSSRPFSRNIGFKLGCACIMHFGKNVSISEPKRYFKLKTRKFIITTNYTMTVLSWLRKCSVSACSSWNDTPKLDSKKTEAVSVILKIRLHSYSFSKRSLMFNTFLEYFSFPLISKQQILTKSEFKVQNVQNVKWFTFKSKLLNREPQPGKHWQKSLLYAVSMDLIFR